MRNRYLAIALMAVGIPFWGVAYAARDIERADGSRAEHMREKGGDHRVREHGNPSDGSRDRTYGSGHSEKEVREKEHDKNPDKK